jgi:hypothetical protein
VHVTLSNQVLHGALSGFPAAWLSRPRKQLDAFELKQRCTITWNVPAAALQAALNGGPLQEVLSPNVYTAGTGFRLLCSLQGGRTVQLSMVCTCAPPATPSMAPLSVNPPLHSAATMRSSARSQAGAS